eukprot:NP_508262.1 Uncharacterized protein CELE_ZK402.3 [Caenorhabditis elegans]
MRICNYKSRDGKLTLERIHSKSSKAARKRSTKIMLSADDVRLMTFLVEKTKEANEPLVATKVFMEFGKKENARCSDGAYYRKFHKKLAPNMDQLDNYSIESRVRENRELRKIILNLEALDEIEGLIRVWTE